MSNKLGYMSSNSLSRLAAKALRSGAENALWREYFSLVDSLYTRRIWAYDYEEEGGFTRDDGSRRPPRFVAVVEQDHHWEMLQARAAEVAGLKTKWPVQLLDEVWGWGRVMVGETQHAQRLEAGEEVALLPLVERAKSGPQGVKQAIATLEAAGHAGRVHDGALVVIAGPAGLTLRQGAGRSFVLRGWSPAGELLHPKLSVGVVVIRGCEKGIQLEPPKLRKGRKDALTKFGGWESWGFYI